MAESDFSDFITSLLGARPVISRGYVVMGVRHTYGQPDVPGALFGTYPTVQEAEEALAGFKRSYPSASCAIFTLSEDGKEWIKLATGERIPRG